MFKALSSIAENSCLFKFHYALVLEHCIALASIWLQHVLNIVLWGNNKLLKLCYAML